MKKKRMSQSAAMAKINEEQDRATISVRKVSVEPWNEVKEIARSQGRSLWAVLDEMMQDWLGKYRR